MRTTRSFQSLLHQGISLLPSRCDGAGIPGPNSFNPFFIRASVYCLRPLNRALVQSLEFQSLLHQGISLLDTDSNDGEEYKIYVSIPSSSGHQFTVFYSYEMINGLYCLRFQSLLHQGISLLDSNLFAIGPVADNVSIPSSSGHQFTGTVKYGTRQVTATVSIPSSSGHQFTGSL